MCFTGPLIARPFLAAEDTTSSSMSNFEQSNMTSLDHSDYGDIFEYLETRAVETVSPVQETHILIPYSIASGLFLLIAVIHYIARHVVPYKQESMIMRSSDNMTSSNNTDVKCIAEKNSIDTKSPNTVDDAENSISTSSQLELSQMPLRYSLILIPVTALLLGLQGGTEQTVFSFLETFAITIPMKLTKARGALLNSVLFGFFTLSRFISIFVAMKVKPKYMILMDLIVVTIGAVMMHIFAVNSCETGLWIGVAILGFGYVSLCNVFTQSYPIYRGFQI